VLHTKKLAKIGVVGKTPWRFGTEDLVKTKFIKKFVKITWTGLFESFEKFKIASLEAEIQLSKLQLKSQIHTSLNRS
jgi:hypothetical protein